MMRRGHIPVTGSERAPVPGARKVGPSPQDERVEVTVVVRARSSDPLPIEQLTSQPLGERQHMTRREYERTMGADPADIERVDAFAREYGLEVIAVDAARRSVALAGSVAQMSAAFRTELARYESPDGAYRGRTGPVHVPAELGDVVEAVLGLDDRPQAVPHFRTLSLDDTAAQPRGRGVSFTPDKLAQVYDFPAAFDGSGQKIAIVELGGGYRTADLKTYFARLGITPPKVTAVSVDGAKNSPTGDPSGPDGEVMLDIEVVGAIAPGAQILVYFAPNTDRGFFDAIGAAIHDRRAPSVISISWGAAEAQWTTQAMTQFDQAFQAAVMLGVTVCSASGDSGSTDGIGDGRAHVDFTASSPHVLACGGTRLEASDGSISREVVWNAGGGATGGGISDVFPLPSWQSSAKVPPSANAGGRHGRGVPDVAGDADPATGYQVRVDGQDAVFGGTSAVAPLWAALVARINQRLGKPIGFLNPVVYSAAGQSALNDITTGTNGAYNAAKGWDACTGLGSPDGARLLAAMTT
ncbi:MAG: kumamolisin [Gaiellaceae bacterium]|jgi:kumamolisin|nr:kumamolisin [Gaiellaceae bacterium]